MRELRKQALESHKKPSRKSVAKAGFLTPSGASTPAKNSPAASKVNSPAMSRVGSRAGSAASEDEEELDYDDGSDEEITTEEANTWETILKDVTQEIIDVKGSTTASREKALQQYVRILQHVYAVEEIGHQERDLLIAFLRSVRMAPTDLEAELALKAVGLTAITSEEGNWYADCAPRVKRTIQEEGPAISTKVAAIRTLCILAATGGLADSALIKVMDFFLEIVETDGQSIEAEDEPEPVQAALKAYAVLASFVDDISEQSVEHVEIIMEQLDSTSPGVQVEAGMAIALLHEKSFKVPDADDELDGLTEGSIFRKNDDPEERVELVRMYHYSRNPNQILGKVSSLASIVGKTRRKDAKETRASFRYILGSLEDPRRGPGYSTDVDVAGFEVGPRLHMKLRSGTATKPPLTVVFEDYGTYAQVMLLKSCLQGGFNTHYWQQNPIVLETVPAPKKHEFMKLVTPGHENSKKALLNAKKSLAKNASAQKHELSSVLGAEE